MMENKVVKSAIQTIQLEAQSIQTLVTKIDDNFRKVVELIFVSKGRVIVSGIGKSAIIAQKIVATFNSTGTPALYMHAADAIHGDLGMIQKDDIVIIISKSGESPEIKALVPLIKRFMNPIVGIVGNIKSFLATESNYFLDTTVDKEACINNLAPTTSTTAQMVMGDALAVALMELNNFSGTDFAKYHPGGNLGKRLYLTVEDLIKNNEKPLVKFSATIKEVIFEMTSKRLGVTAVEDADGNICGIITDGDLRRMLERNDSMTFNTAIDVSTKSYKYIGKDVLAINALEEFRKFDISQLLVFYENNYIGVLHLHDLVREGII